MWWITVWWHRDHHQEAFTTIFTDPLTHQLASRRDMMSTWITHFEHTWQYTYSSHAGAYILSWDWGRELHMRVLLNDPPPFTLYPSSVFTLLLIQLLPLSFPLLIPLLLILPQLWLAAVLSQTRIPNVYHQPSGCCQGINNHCIWWLLDEM